MRLNTRMDMYLMPEIFRLFFLITGEGPWLVRRKQLEHRKRTEPGVSTIINTVHSRELTIAGLILDRYRDFGYPSAYERPELLASYSFVTIFVRLYQKLPAVSCSRLVSTLIGDLQHKNLSGLTLELETAAHLSNLGFDLQFHDLIGGSTGSFDFLAVRDGLEVEIDCKAISADTGNPITSFGAAAITSFSDRAIKSYREADKTIILQIITAKKVSKRDVIAKSIASDISEALRIKGKVKSEFSTVNYECKSSKEVPEFKGQPTVQYPLLEGELEGWDHIIVSPDNGQGGVILLLKSTEKSTRVERIANTLKESVDKQFSRSRPVVLFVRLADMTGEVFMKSLGKRTFMNDICENLFYQKDKRPHIAGVVFVPGTPVIKTKIDDRSRSAGEQSLSYFIRNEHHPLRDNPILALLHPPLDMDEALSKS